VPIEPSALLQQTSTLLRHTRLHEYRRQHWNHCHREDQGTEEGDDHSQGQWNEHLAFHAVERQEGNKGQGDDQFPEEARPPHFQDSTQDDGQTIGERQGPARRLLTQMALDILHLHDGGIDDHPQRNGEAAQWHQIGRQADLLHDQERRQSGQRQGQGHYERTAEIQEKQIQDEHHDRGPLEQGPLDGIQGARH
jgi:hypothetical protein